MYGAQITLADGGGAMARSLTIVGHLSTEELIALVVKSGGFDPEGARAIVASTLGFTPATLPARVPFQIAATGSEP